MKVEKIDNWKSALASEAIEYILADARELLVKPPEHIINLTNGLYDLNTGKLLAHTPDHLSPIQLPVHYDAGARCPRWERQIEETWPQDAYEVAFEIPGRAATGSTSGQRAVMFQGEGGEGKGTYLTALGEFLGLQNVATLSLQRIEDNRFSVANLYGKLANICDDLPADIIKRASKIKSITGKGRITGERKNKDEFDFLCYAMMIFSTNQPPRVKGVDSAWFDRWRVVWFLKGSWRGSLKEIPRNTLDAELAAPAELSGVLNRALKLLPRVIERGISETVSMKEAHDKFRALTDPFTLWLSENTVEGPDCWMSKREGIDHYSFWARENEMPTMSDTAFGLALKRQCPNVTDERRTVKGKPGVECYRGIGLREGILS